MIHDEVRNKVDFFAYKKKVAKYLTKSLYYRFIGNQEKSLHYFKKISEINYVYGTDFVDDIEISVNSLLVSLYYAIESYDMATIRQLMDQLCTDDIINSMDENQKYIIELLKVRIEILKKEIEKIN